MPGRFFPAVIEAGKAAEMLIVPAAGRAVERGKLGAALPAPSGAVADVADARPALQAGAGA